MRFLHVCLPVQPAHGPMGEEGEKGTGKEEKLKNMNMQSAKA
jgi:hypothetical protein